MDRTFKLNRTNIIYILLCFASMNFFMNGSLILFISCLVSILSFKFIIPKDKCFFLLILFTIFCTLSIVYFDYPYSEIIKSFNYSLIYLMGYFELKRTSNKIQFIKQSLFFIFLGFFIQLFLDFFFNFNMSLGNSRIYYSFWTGEKVSVTLIGVLCSVIIGYSFYGIFFSKKKFIQIISIFGLFLSFFINFSTATRTPIILFFICYILMIFIFFYSLNFKKKLKFTFIFVIISCILISFYSSNFLNIRSYYENSALYQRFEIEKLETPRFKLMIDHFNNIFKYPLGGGFSTEVVGQIPHNFLQEVGDTYGILPFICMLLFLFSYIINLIKIIFVKNKKDYHYLIISLGIALLLQSLLEPIISGYPLILWIMILLLSFIVLINNNVYIGDVLYENNSN